MNHTHMNEEATTAQPVLELCSQYESMNNGPHEGPLMTVTAPCILAQLSFWMPEGESWTGKIEIMRSIFGAIRDSLHRELEKSFGLQAPIEYQKNVPHESGGRIRSWRHLVEMPGYRIELFVHSHSEYWRVLIKAEIARKKTDKKTGATVSPDQHTPPPFLAALSANCTRDKLHQYATFVLGVIGAVNTCDKQKDFFKSMFAAFYGTVTDASDYEGCNELVNTECETVITEASRSGWDRLRRFSNARGFIAKNWDHISTLHGLASEDVELTASTFNSKRAIYVSTLGHPKSQALGSPHLSDQKPEVSTLDHSKSQALESGHRGCHVPVVYSIFSCIDDPWQLGRLLDTINSMGAVRLAALRDIDKISEMAEDMRKLRTGLRNGKNVRELRSEIEQVLRRDVSFRIERSGRYWSQLQKRIKRLRIEDLEGFQPYDRFVDRRIGDTIAFIAGAGQQIAQLRKEIDLRYQAGQSEAIVRLQKTAEVLSIFPIAYYGSGLLPDGVKDYLSKQLLGYGETSVFGISFNSTLIEAVAAFAVPVLLAWLIVRIVHWRLT